MTTPVGSPWCLFAGNRCTVPPAQRRMLPPKSWPLFALGIGVVAMLAGADSSGSLAAESGGRASAARPNFLIVVADDMGYSDAGCYGGEIQTPNLDRLAAGGLRFTQMYSAGRCWPSRACILTGYYAQQVRMDPPQGPLPDWCRVLPHYLKPQGYRCYHVGKWHLMGARRPVADGGFDRSWCLEDHNRYFSPRVALLDDQRQPPVPEGSDFYVTTAMADYSLEFLRQHQREYADRPFLLYLAFTAPHFPLHARREDIARYAERFRQGWDVLRRQRYERMRRMGLITCGLSPREPDVVPFWNFPEAQLQKEIGPGEVGRAVPWDRLSDQQKQLQATKMAIHAAMIDRMDRELGRVLEQIQAMGALENTVVMFVSDNGASAEQIIRGDGHDPAALPGSARTFLCLGPGFSTLANTPFRLHKHWVHEGGIASPLVVHWPAGLKARGELRHTPCHFIDLLPTVLELAGAHLKKVWHGAEAPPLPGRSLVPAFAADRPIQRDYLYWHHQTNRAIRVGDWKLVSAGSKDAEGPWELYDLRTDRSEMNDQAAAYPEKVRQLSQLWEECEKHFRKQAGPPPAKAAKSGKAAKSAMAGKKAKPLKPKAPAKPEVKRDGVAF